MHFRICNTCRNKTHDQVIWGMVGEVERCCTKVHALPIECLELFEIRLCKVKDYIIKT